MRIVCQTKLQFKEGNSDKIYEVDLCEAGDKYFVNFRYGRRGAELKEGTKTIAPVGFAEAEKIFQKLVDEKTRKGYHVVGETSAAEKPKVSISKTFDEEARKNAVLTQLRSPKAKSHPRIERIVWRAGELKIKEAAPFIANLIGTAKELRDYCCAWSLGFCGDAAAIPALEKLTNHPAEFVRRIAREALLKIGSEGTRAKLFERALADLPETLRTIVESGSIESFETALGEEISRQKSGALTLLYRIYEIDNEITRPVLLNLLAEIPLKPRYFKALRQIFKTAEYRRDAEVFGIIAKRFETEKHNFTVNPWGGYILIPKENGDYDPMMGIYDRVKQSELKKENSRIAYGDKTRDYFRRRTWRTLRRMGEIGDSDYVKMATGALLAFSDADARAPQTSTIYDYYHTGRWDWQNPKITEIRWDKFSPYLLFNHILYENSPRYEHKTGSRGFRTKGTYKPGDPAPPIREEAFPKLWEAQPVGLLHLLAESACEPVHEFAVKALRDCGEFTEKLDVGAIRMLLERPYEITNRFGFELAAARFDALAPDVELVTAVALCKNAEAREQAFRWIGANRDLFAKNNAAMRKLLNADQPDTRKFAAEILGATNYGAAEAQNLIALLISDLLALGENRREIAADLSAAIFAGFSRELRNLNLFVVNDLLAHPLAEVQILGANILVNHEVGAEKLPNELIDSLINSPYEQIRGVGIKLFGQLPEENLLRRETGILSFLTHALADVHHAIRPTAARLSANHSTFRRNLVNAIFIELLKPETAEGVHSRLLETLREIPDWASFADFETAKLLIKSESAAANEIGGLIFQNRAEGWRDRFTTDEIIEFSSHEILAVRRSAWAIAEKTVARLRGEVSLLIRALDAKWLDSREFWRGFFRAQLTAAQLTPDVLVAICDSVNDETQKFGRELLLHYFREENGVEYLIKLSEHPSGSMQFFATNYLENYAAGAPEKFEKLAPYFVRVLSLVNRARASKDRVLRFMETEALKSEQSARIAAGILARQSATLAIGDKAAMIEAMLKIRRAFPQIDLPIKVKQAEVRTNVF
ncbi:MAG TPA: HEAT repeat domain-containing protein [Pyrinomonadaceae bacterium]|jgi:predicted DNA-binding WGR domain protein